MNTSVTPKRILKIRFSSFFLKCCVVFSLLLLVFCKSYSFANSPSKLSHHVIVLVDRSKGMQQEYKENSLEDVFGYLDMVCFKKIGNNVGRQLLIPNQDFISIVGFGSPNLNDKDFDQYISSSNTSGNKFGCILNEDFDNSIIENLFQSIESSGGLSSKSNHFFNLNYGFPTVAIPMGIDAISKKSKDQKFNKTFIIRVSDKELNSAGVGFELKNYESRLNVTKVKQKDNELKSSFNLIELVELSKEFDRKSSKLKFKGKKYHIEVFELIPNMGISVGSLIEIKSPLNLKRGIGGKYSGQMVFSSLNKEYVQAVSLQLQYILNGEQISMDQIDLTSDKSEYVPLFEIAGLKNNDQLVVKANVIAQYDPSIYPGTMLTSELMPELNARVEAIYEKQQKIVGLIPIANWMMFANNQSLVNGVITGFFIFILLAVAFFIIRKKIIAPYVVSRKQFNITNNFDAASLPIDINLNDDRSKEEVLFSVRLARESKMVLNLIEKNSECTIQRLGLQVGDNAPRIIADNFDEIFEMVLPNGQKGNSFSNVALINKDIDVTIKFHPNKISVPFGMADVQNYQRFDLQFVFQPNLAEEIQAELFPIELNLIKEKANLEFTLTKNRDFLSNFIYAPNVYEFGRLTFANDTKQGFSYPLEIKDINLCIIGEIKPDYSDALIIQIENSDVIMGINDFGLYASNILPSKSCTVLLSIDLSKIKNPIDTDNFTIKISGNKRLNGIDFIEFEEVLTGSNFSLEKNKQKTELYVQVDGVELSTPIQEEAIVIDKNIGYSIDRNAKVEVLSGIIGNKAIALNHENPTSLMLRNFEFTAKLLSENDPFAKSDVNIEDVIFTELSTPSEYWKLVNEQLIGEIELVNQNDSFIRYSIGFKDIDFISLPAAMENKMQVSATLSYEVAIKTLEHTVYKLVSHEFVFDLKQNEGEEWLSIDFGTSAIVARYGDGREDNTALDLQVRHQELITNGYSSSNIQEYDTTFLSSSMLLSKKHMEELSNIEYYDKLGDSVQLSPTLDSIKNERQYLSPYMKALIGFDRLPDLYQDRLKDMGKLDRDKDIIVTHIIKSAYNMLFNKYLEPIIYDKDKRYEKNKIVLSVPNDFTLEKKKLIKNVVLDVFPDAWGNYIKFVSESDAIAWYYASYYDQLIRKYSNVEVPKPAVQSREKNGDTVLVYDMGAGTLDLTLFTKKPLADNNYELEILGKVGMTTGGNYLDTILAEVVYDELIENNGLEDKHYFHPTQQYQDDYNVVIKYKYFIKDVLKPALETGVIEDEEIYFTDSAQKIKLSDIDLDNIKAADKFQEFIDKVTIGALDLLKQNLVSQPNKIETLVISGRGGQLYGLKDALMKAIKSTFDSTPIEIVPEANEMKSMVAKGALEYARFKVNSSNVFKFPIIPARYGYIIKRGAEREYHELIAPKHNEQFVNMPEFSADKLGVYFEKEIILNNVNEVVLVQTYYHDKESILDNYTEDDHGNFYEASSVIYKLSQVPYYRKGNGKLKVFICEDTEVFARLEADEIKIEVEPKIPSIIDIQNSTSFKRSMWPIV